MPDPQEPIVVELLGLASEVKTRLRQLETLGGELTSDTQRAAHIPGKAAMGRVRNHLELALQALGSSRRSRLFSEPDASDQESAAEEGVALGHAPTAQPANPLKITGFYSDEVRNALRDLRERKGGFPAGGTGEIRPGIWVRNRVDEIHRALSSAFGDEENQAPMGAEAQPLGPPEFTGNTEVLSIPELIGFFQLQAKTGVLAIAGPEEDFTLEYMRGELVHAASSDSPQGERLGEILVELGHLTEQQLKELLAGMDGAERTGEILRRRDVIGEDAISQALQHQVQSIFHRLCTMTGCRFSFREGLMGEPNARARYNITLLLLESARQRDETEHGDSMRDAG